VEPEAEHGFTGAHASVESAIRTFLSSIEASIIEIDTRMDQNLTGLRSPAEVDAVIARMDMVVTTRLHGLVLAIKNSVPAIAIDPHLEPAKVHRQAEAIGWPLRFTASNLTQESLMAAYRYCLEPNARMLAAKCFQEAEESVAARFQSFMAQLKSSS
jgi:polysaccharide pyruvyl transferase WcaK-like protein